jgi:hypothetical protein
LAEKHWKTNAGENFNGMVSYLIAEMYIRVEGATLLSV